MLWLQLALIQQRDGSFQKRRLFSLLIMFTRRGWLQRLVRKLTHERAETVPWLAARAWTVMLRTLAPARGWPGTAEIAAGGVMLLAGLVSLLFLLFLLFSVWWGRSGGTSVWWGMMMERWKAVIRGWGMPSIEKNISILGEKIEHLKVKSKHFSLQN